MERQAGKVVMIQKNQGEWQEKLGITERTDSTKDCGKENSHREIEPLEDSEEMAREPTGGVWIQDPRSRIRGHTQVHRETPTRVHPGWIGTETGLDSERCVPELDGAWVYLSGDRIGVPESRTPGIPPGSEIVKIGRPRYALFNWKLNYHFLFSKYPKTAPYI